MKQPFFENEQELNEFKQWLTALESGTYSQTKGSLQDSEGYCCLGVACAITIPEDKQRRIQHKNILVLVGSLPNDQKNSPEWLKKIDQEFYERGIQDFGNVHLYALNDNYNYTFIQIAAALRHAFYEELK